MPTNKSSFSALARLFKDMPEAAVKAIEDVQDQYSEGGEAPITRQEALTGQSEEMRGGGASPMIRRHSNLEPQMGRQAEYDTFSNILSDIAKAMKAQTDAITAALAPKAKVSKSVDGELSYLAVVEKSIKKAKTELFKAETEVEAEEDSTADCVGKAERLVTKAAELLAKAEDEDDADEDRVEKARTDIRKITKALKPFKDAAVAKAAEVAKAEADALAKAEADKTTAVAKAEDDKKDEKEEKEEDKGEMSKSDLETTVSSLQDQFGLVSKSVNEVLEMVAGLSRNPKQPTFVAKSVQEAKTEEPVDFAARAQEMADSGLIKDTELLKCQSMISRMAIIKGGAAGSLNIDQIKADIAASSSGVREVFASMFTA